MNRTRSLLLIVFLFLLLASFIDMKPIIKSGYSRNHFLSKSNSPDSSDGFWANVYFVITASDSFFGG